MNIKQHFQDHKELYVGVGIGATVATLVGARYISNSYNTTTTITDSYNTTVNFGGHCHKIIQNNKTGEIFASVTEAAEALGIDRRNLSKHLNGQMDNVQGMTFSILGLGARSAS